MDNWSLTRRKQALRNRSIVIQHIRQFFTEEGYLEVDTPLRIPAPAPESYIDAVSSGEWFLQTSPEICMKRMLAAGFERVFQVCRCWRDSERGERHLPEFTMLEWYRVDSDYRDLMDDCEALIRYLAQKFLNDPVISFGQMKIAVDLPWERLTVAEAFRRFTTITMEEALESDLFDELMVSAIEPNLGIGRPTFLHDYPAQRGALALLKGEDRSVAERFELYAGGMELANGFSELTDGEEQRKRFEEEAALRGALGKTIYPMPDKFLQELPYITRAAGIALGIDRLIMLLLNISTIDGVVAFTPEEL